MSVLTGSGPKLESGRERRGLIEELIALLDQILGLSDVEAVATEGGPEQQRAHRRG